MLVDEIILQYDARSKKHQTILVPSHQPFSNWFLISYSSNLAIPLIWPLHTIHLSNTSTLNLCFNTHLQCKNRSVVIQVIRRCLFRKLICIHQYTSVGNGGAAGVLQNIGIIKGILVGLRPCRNPSGEFLQFHFKISVSCWILKFSTFILLQFPCRRVYKNNILATDMKLTL